MVQITAILTPEITTYSIANVRVTRQVLKLILVGIFKH